MGGGHAHHAHRHGHGHGHDHGRGVTLGAAFVIGIALNFGFVVVEAVAGWLSGSMALLADAGHNLSDVLGLIAAYAALRVARRRPSKRYTYGLRRASVLASLANAVLLLVAVGMILVEALRRLQAPPEVQPGTMIWVAAAGIVINLATALFLRRDQDDLNVRGAYLHMVADALVSVGVVVAGLTIRWTGWTIVDPLVSIAIALVIVAGTWSLLRESLALSLDAVPTGLDTDEVRAALAELPGVGEVHHVHIWPLSTTEVALTAHIVAKGDARAPILTAANAMLASRFGIGHATLQVEDAPCPGGGG